jgi:hypothetical protein
MGMPVRIAAGLLAAILTTGVDASRAASPFAALAGCITISPTDQTRLDANTPIVRVLPARGHQIGVITVMRIAADPPRLIAWTRDIADLKKNALVKGIQRLSSPPVITDFSALSFDADDVSALRSCTSQDCSIKITAAEGRALHTELSGADGDKRAPDAARKLLLDRATRFLSGGLAASPKDPDDPGMAVTFGELVRAAPCVTAHFPALSGILLHDSPTPILPVETFLYWSKEQATGRAITSITQSIIVDGANGTLPPHVEVAVVGKQIYSTHYTNGSFTLTLLLRDDTTGHRYLVYLNRTDVDLIGGVFGGLTRRLIERRARSESETLLTALRQRIEAGDPPR